MSCSITSNATSCPAISICCRRQLAATMVLMQLCYCCQECVASSIQNSTENKTGSVVFAERTECRLTGSAMLCKVYLSPLCCPQHTVTTCVADPAACCFLHETIIDVKAVLKEADKKVMCAVKFNTTRQACVAFLQHIATVLCRLCRYRLAAIAISSILLPALATAV